MPLQLTGHIELPANKGSGGFDHAAVHAATGHVYVAHTANDAVDVFDDSKYLFSIPGLKAVAGALVCDEANLIFSSNRGENTVALNGSVVGRGCIVEPGSLLTEGKVFPDRSRIAGRPAKVTGEVGDEEAEAQLRRAREASAR